ncbi:BTAD domain-containing putative transcriptional regulator [Rugamonas sp. DEMB1]|uniref:BTAD domain-containing putative transcriptional regulator n=1 Tax=Rugamonas sp. DEMB1 TaxID=3039386 RepID=UPI002446EC95|nr:BTAD domain-containing putative transcriptional regulator [Rugamonas sp. DEMB1]WGG51242.1 BTAD domain-containing putative transcriptional regulator [Rugamonas sp. DEMB1]
MRSLAKTSRPAARLIGRRRAVQAMLAAPATLTWIAAPAGAGKTSLGLEFCQASQAPVAWLRLDEGDTDPASFLLYFEQAIVNGALLPGWRAPPLLREHLPAPLGYLRLLVRSLAGAPAAGAGAASDSALALAATPPAAPCHIVLDDAHRCQDAPFFKQLLDVLAAELPPTLRVLVLSRAPAPAACARLLAHGDMRQLDPAELAFSPDETGLLLQALGVPRAAEQAAPVYQLTRGWAAGVALVAAWLRRRPDAAPAGDEVLGEALLGYLAEEVFGAFDAEQQDILLAVCWLPHFSGAWAATLSGSPHAADFVARLAAEGALIYAYPDGQYALHPLLRGFLRKWSALHQAEAWRRRMVAACVDLLRDSDNAELAITLALQHAMPERAAGMIEAGAEAMFASARHATLTRWIEALPEALRSAWHHYWLGLAVFMSDTARARAELLLALPAFGAQQQPRYRFLAVSAIISSYFFNGAAEQPLRAFLRQHIEPEADYHSLANPALQAHLTHSVWSALLMTDPGHRDMALWEGRALEALRRPAEATVKARLASMLAQHYFHSGRYAALRALCALMAALPEAATAPPCARYMSFLPTLYAELAGAEPARFDASYAAARRCAEDSGIHIMDCHYALIEASARMLRGELGKARAVLAEVAAQIPPGHYKLLAQLQLGRSWLASWSGAGRAALEHALLARAAAASLGSVPDELCAQIAACLAWSLFDRPRCAVETAALRTLAEAGDSPLARRHADLLEAWLSLCDAAGEALAPGALRQTLTAAQLRRAHDCLGRALAAVLAEGGGYLSFATPHILRPLCVQALAAGIAVEQAGALIRTYRLAPPAEAGDNWPWPLRLRCFGGFELRLDDAPLPSQGKSKHRQLDLLKLLAAHAPASVALERAAELLWPDAEGDGARKALETTLSRLRATVGAAGVLLEQGLLSLAPQHCWCDTAALEQALARLQALGGDGQRQAAPGWQRRRQKSGAAGAGTGTGMATTALATTAAATGGESMPRTAAANAACATEAAVLAGRAGMAVVAVPEPATAAEQNDWLDAVAAAAGRVMALYRGELLAGDGASWLLARREYWRARVARALGAAGRALAKAGRPAAAAQVLERALEADPYCKALSSTLMHLHLDSGHYEEGLAAYRRYQRMALGALGAPVAADIEALAQQLLAGAGGAAAKAAGKPPAVPKR